MTPPMDGNANDPRGTLGPNGPRLASTDPNAAPPESKPIPRHVRVAHTLRRLADMVEANGAVAVVGCILLEEGGAAPFHDLGNVHVFQAIGAMDFVQSQLLEGAFKTRGTHDLSAPSAVPTPPDGGKN